ncbi:enoyl-CoA hydratase [Gandjariella thermophila]|uniref:Enoyl-CoA hydratase n=2 Tax=Gandjariella thermophila TaxID=1931992 RepID=A0A4D4J8Z8_9PSEU|nr:enoyl-CoA hydratase [Gandjariella thermophila]
MDLAMYRAYYDALADAEASAEVRAVVVTGAGRTFCAGADPALLDALREPETQRELVDGLGYPPHFPLTLKTPIIAAVNGSAAGLGLVHALHADVRFLADHAVLCTAFSRLGLIAETGSAWLLSHLVGAANALDMLLSARKVGAAEAVRMGLAQHVAPAGEVVGMAVDYARQLATACSPTSMAVMKRQVWASLRQTAAEAAEESVALMLESFHRPDFAEAVRAVRERRAPSFAPLRPPDWTTDAKG